MCSRWSFISRNCRRPVSIRRTRARSASGPSWKALNASHASITISPQLNQDHEWWVMPVTVFISSPLTAEHVETIRAVDPARVEVIYEPDLHPPRLRYYGDHKGLPFT